MKEFIYSRNAVYETLRARRRQIFRLEISQGVQQKGRVVEILQMAQERRIPILEVPRARMDKIHHAHQGVILETSAYPYCNLEDILDLAHTRQEQSFLLLLDTLNDPQNFGPLLRTAEAVGVHGVVLPLARSVEVTPAVVNSSSGASEYLLIAQKNLSQTIDTIRGAGIWTVGLDQNGMLAGENEPSFLEGPLALTIGSEGEGIRTLIKSKCDFLLKLPMQGQVESLNASVAGSIALYLAYLARQRSS